MIVQTAKPTDAQQIAQIQVKTWQAAYQGQIADAILDAQSVEWRVEFWRKRLMQTAGSVLVAEEHGLIGFCDLVPSRDKDADTFVAEIAAIYVLPRHWRKGVGRALMAHALAEAHRQGYREVTLWVLASNAKARKFYEAIGFSLDGDIKTEKASNGSDLQEVRYRRQLFSR